MSHERAAEQLREALDDAARSLVGREVLVELVALAAVAHEHVLVVGPPGTAKSEAVRRVAAGLSGRYFEYLLGRFTEPSEIFGPVDLRRLRDGVVETQTDRMLPEAELAFLDEVFLGSTAILNTLLALLNERVFRRGHTIVNVPLRVCVGATNTLPTDDGLAAFADRFILRVFVHPVPDAHLEDLLEGGWALESAAPARTVPLAAIDALATVARTADVRSIRPALSHAVRALRSAGIELSDRRVVKLQRLAAAAAALAGRVAPTVADLWPIVYAVPTEEGQHQARDVLRELLDDSENPALRAAAEDASRGVVARAVVIAEAGEALLDDAPAAGEPRDQWRLRLEAIARDIDAGFDVDDLPAPLRDVRGRIVAALAEPAP